MVNKKLQMLAGVSTPLSLLPKRAGEAGAKRVLNDETGIVQHTTFANAFDALRG
jgi:hypothetical protein